MGKTADNEIVCPNCGDVVVCKVMYATEGKVLHCCECGKSFKWNKMEQHQLIMKIMREKLANM